MSIFCFTFVGGIHVGERSCICKKVPYKGKAKYSGFTIKNRYLLVDTVNNNNDALMPVPIGGYYHQFGKQLFLSKKHPAFYPTKTVQSSPWNTLIFLPLIGNHYMDTCTLPPDTLNMSYVQQSPSGTR
jgi:hypothetical protein